MGHYIKKATINELHITDLSKGRIVLEDNGQEPATLYVTEDPDACDPKVAPWQRAALSNDDMQALHDWTNKYLHRLVPE